MISPVRRTVRVPLSPDAAFELFTRRIASWWPLAKLAVDRNDAVSCHMEARVGGRIVEVSRTGEERIWGTVLAWNEPASVVFSWHPGRIEDSAQTVEVRFVAEAQGTRVELEHRGWERLGAEGQRMRDLHDAGWATPLERYESLARDETPAAATVPPGWKGCQG